MNQRTHIKPAQREAQWRDCIARQKASGQTVAVFCREESISQATFYLWRKRLGVQSKPPKHHACPTVAKPFIDLGEMVHDKPTSSGWDIRLDLGGGLTLSIARR